MVSGPGEGIDNIAKARADEDREGFTIAAAVKDAFFAAVENSFVLIDGTIGEVAKAEGAGSSFLAKELFEGEGASGGLDNAASVVVVEAEFSVGEAERAAGGVGFYDGLEVRRRGLSGLDLHGRCSHSEGLYHGGVAATASGDGGSIFARGCWVSRFRARDIRYQLALFWWVE
jgi:hypothetical protein